MNEKLINRNPATRLLVLTIPSGSAETEAVPLSRGTIPDPAPSGRASTHALRYLQPVPGLSGTNIKLHAGQPGTGGGYG